MVGIRCIAVCLLACLSSTVLAGEEKKEPKKALDAEKLAAAAKESMVVIHYTGRDGKQHGLGAGFVVAEDGLIATNFHVIGEARPIRVQLADGTKLDATSVHASDRHLDLALVRIPAKNLKPLTLGDSDKLKSGQAIVALGHPRGLEHSVVAGVLSGKREFEGVSMLQLAIPIEQGNSGGPVLDEKGQVVGIVTMKALVTANLGFAVPSNALKPLLDRPNPITMDRWLTIGALDPAEWKPMLGGRWRQRAGRILSDGVGTGFGGRTLCYWQREAPKDSFELGVTVKLDDEAGAAGLIFGGDGAHEHYGFYPTGGKLRITRFAGPDVFSWKILQDIKTAHYRPGEWNSFKVKVAKDKFTCFVNEQKVAEIDEPDYAGTKVGLAKFRDTVAEFKRFQAAERLPSNGADEKTLATISKMLAGLGQHDKPSTKDLERLLKLPGAAADVLRDRARLLEKQAEQLRKLALAVHEERTLAELEKELKKKDADADLARAALLVARLDNEEIDVEIYAKELDRWAREITGGLPKDAAPAKRLEALDKFLFKERGFHGSRHDYYSRNNSYLNEVIDDREGLPITLSVLYMELARRLGLNVVGVALPGHFIVRHEPAEGEKQLIDVFAGAKPMTREEAEARVQNITGEAAKKKDFEAVTKKAIILRMLHNLINVAQREKDRDGMLRYLDGIVAVDPEAHEERWVRAVFRFQAGNHDGSLVDCEYLLKNGPPEMDRERVQELRRVLLKDTK
ncbi:MAG: trypsin-like peptidase domain-containing protein [Gemmataceae bacterium]|nr:trypsin-like peptidase domain-containing protein [Gemmataceae bacterium]MCI0743403.1 trypsin-like peptidase domain-containing protein [Gemmataceae bacterium]